MTKYEIFKSAMNKLLWRISTNGAYSDIERFNRIEKYIIDNFETPKRKTRKPFIHYSKVD